MLCELEYFQDKANGKVKLDWEAMPLAPRLYRVHTCPNGGIGIGDFIGYQKEEQAAK